MSTTNTTPILYILNLTDNAKALGGDLLGTDGNGNQLWSFGDKVANRWTDEEGNLLWSGSVAGWGYTAEDAIA